MIQGVKINTPHYLAKMEGIVKGTSTYTVIVSQLESLSTIYYTLRVHADIVYEFCISRFLVSEEDLKCQPYSR